MYKVLLALLMLFFPMVQGATLTCAPQAVSCAEGVVAAIPIAAAGFVGTLKDFVQCIIDGTTDQCRFECTVGFLEAGCEGEVFETCMKAQQQKCWAACPGGINLLNQGCFSTAVDLLALIPDSEIGAIAALASVFFSCVDLVGCGIVWVVTSILSALGGLAQDGKKEFCSLLSQIVDHIPALSPILSLYAC
jgi:hypothetical protein